SPRESWALSSGGSRRRRKVSSPESGTKPDAESRSRSVWPSPPLSRRVSSPHSDRSGRSLSPSLVSWSAAISCRSRHAVTSWMPSSGRGVKTAGDALGHRTRNVRGKLASELFAEPVRGRDELVEVDARLDPCAVAHPHQILGREIPAGHLGEGRAA